MPSSNGRLPGPHRLCPARELVDLARQGRRGRYARFGMQQGTPSYLTPRFVLELDTTTRHWNALKLPRRTRHMPFSVYIAKPPADGGYGPHIYKVGKTTEEDVGSRISALNDAGSNYPTSNGENWELVDHFEFANQEQMDTFETAMVANLAAGLDPKGTGATELFQSTTLSEDVHQAAKAAAESLVESNLVDVGSVVNLAAEHGIAGAQLYASTGDLPQEAVGQVADWLLELLTIGVPVLGIGLLLWRGKRVYQWLAGQWEQASDRARSAAHPRPTEPPEVTEARRELEQARRAMDSRQSK